MTTIDDRFYGLTSLPPPPPPSREKQEEISQARERLLSQGCDLPPPKPKSSHFDSNCITPGTEFMARLAICLQYYVHDRLNTNPAWQGIKVRGVGLGVVGVARVRQ